jgi:hypothetical protein
MHVSNNAPSIRGSVAFFIDGTKKAGARISSCWVPCTSMFFRERAISVPVREGVTGLSWSSALFNMARDTTPEVSRRSFA